MGRCCSKIDFYEFAIYYYIATPSRRELLILKYISINIGVYTPNRFLNTAKVQQFFENANNLRTFFDFLHR